MAKQIFIVEDDHTCETILRRTIRSVDPDANITWAESAEQAILALEKDGQAGKKYDLIIADIFLAGPHTGIELWNNCRDQFPETPVLITSSLPVNQFFDTIGRNSVAPPYLPKPFYAGECAQVIGALLSYR